MSRSYKLHKTDHPRLKAYVPDKKQGQEKFEPTLSKYGKFSTPDDKLEARNANRSLKKSLRQEFKSDLKKYL
jgi:hypothetical protein